MSDIVSQFYTLNSIVRLLTEVIQSSRQFETSEGQSR